MAPVEEKKRMDVEAMMKVYQDLEAPGEPHPMLVRLEGPWIFKGNYWTDPDRPTVKIRGETESTLILDRRFLSLMTSGRMADLPFAKLSLMGYDNRNKEYVAVSMGSLSEGMILFEGTAGADGKTITLKNTSGEPVRGPRQYRAVVRIIDRENCAFEMYVIRNGKETKLMELICTRKE